MNKSGSTNHYHSSEPSMQIYGCCDYISTLLSDYWLYNYVQHMNLEGQSFVWKNEVSSLNEISFVWIAKFTALQQVAINVSMFSNTECTLWYLSLQATRWHCKKSTSYSVTLSLYALSTAWISGSRNVTESQ